MPLRRFSVSVLVRVALLLATMVGLAAIIGRADLFFNQVILGILVILQTVALIRFVRRTNRDLAKFLLAIKHADFSVHFGGEPDRSFRALHAAFAEILDTYQRVNADREVQYQYLELLVSHIKVGIISLRGDDEITLINQPARDLLQTDTYHYWHNLAKKHPHLVEVVDQLSAGESRLLELRVGEENKRLSVQVSSAVLLRQTYRIITIQDIEQEINQSETAAYHRLIRTLTHEMMNSVTPIASLSETLLMMIRHEDGRVKSPEAIDQNYLQELALALQTIGKRSEGLLHFVEDYRKLTQLPPLRAEAVSVRELLATVGRLLQPELRTQGVRWRVALASDELMLWGDPHLVEQVLINLITNSRQALAATPDPRLTVRSYRQGEELIIVVTDNGPGIDSDKIDQIFVPFFSTKPQGSGIGLSLSRHIMTLHRGTIRVQSPPGGPTSFLLSFRTPPAQKLKET